MFLQLQFLRWLNILKKEYRLLALRALIKGLTTYCWDKLNHPLISSVDIDSHGEGIRLTIKILVNQVAQTFIVLSMKFSLLLCNNYINFIFCNITEEMVRNVLEYNRYTYLGSLMKCIPCKDSTGNICIHTY